jgi:Xaa-Pro aminopeptidase
MFAKEIYKQRRKQLASKVDNGILLFMGNEESPMNFKDNTYHFRQDSTFLYYLGINEPGLAALIDIDEDREVVFGDEMSLDDIVWMGRQETLQEKCGRSDVARVQPASALADHLKKAQAQGLQIHFLPPYRAENKIRLAHLLGLPVQALGDNVSLEFTEAVIAQRSVKSAEEIQEIHKAAAISADIQHLIMRTARPGQMERELVASIQQAALASGGQLAYPAILTTRGEILHNHYYGNTLQEGQLVLNDSGVETALGYAGDLTRTFPVSKTFTSLQKAVYDIVLEAYKQAVGKLGPGVPYLDVHLKSCTTLAYGLKDLGLMKGNIEDAVAQGAHAMFFQCGTGHMMGLDVHDMEDLGEQYVGYTDTLPKNTSQFGLKSLRLGKPLEPGYVLTVEPGLYFIPELIDQWSATDKFNEYINYDKLQEFRGFSGIRVEDNFLITNDGYEMLGKHLALTTTEIEVIRADAF